MANFADYKVIESNTFHLNHDSGSPGDILLSKEISFSLPEEYVAGTRRAKPVLQFLVKPQIANSKLFIFANSSPNYISGGRIDLSNNRNHVVYQASIEDGPLRMVSTIFAGSHLRAGSNDLFFAIETGAAHWIDNIVLFYQRELPDNSPEPRRV